MSSMLYQVHLIPTCQEEAVDAQTSLHRMSLVSLALQNVFSLVKQWLVFRLRSTGKVVMKSLAEEGRQNENAKV